MFGINRWSFNQFFDCNYIAFTWFGYCVVCSNSHIFSEETPPLLHIGIYALYII